MCVCVCGFMCVCVCLSQSHRGSSPPLPRQADNNDVAVRDGQCVCAFVFGSVHVCACMCVCVWFCVYDAKPARESSTPLPRRADNNDLAMQDGQ
jgi:hypothetical protein